MVVEYRSSNDALLIKRRLDALHATVPEHHWFLRLKTQVQKFNFEVADAPYSPVVLFLRLVSQALSFESESDSLRVLGAVFELTKSFIVGQRSGKDADFSTVLPSTEGSVLCVMKCDTGLFFSCECVFPLSDCLVHNLVCNVQGLRSARFPCMNTKG